MADIDLSGVNGLETVIHLRPSFIGIDTIYRSKAEIPEVFLRGAGVPDNFIAYMKSLAGTPSAFEFYSCFIGYSTKDKEFAERLYADLQREHVRCWYAPEDLKIGDKFRPELTRPFASTTNSCSFCQKIRSIVRGRKRKSKLRLRESTNRQGKQCYFQSGLTMR